MSATPTWFGEASRPLLGWVHQPPDGMVRGAVVLCPPFGIELGSTYPTLRVLADHLAAQGLLALRFDYAGTGDSAGDHRASGQVEAWLDSIAEAVGYVRAAGIDDVSLVGLRMGALLATSALARCGPISQLVLWDPCVSGAAYLREQTRLYRLKVGSGEPESPDTLTPGMVFTPETVADLRALEIANACASAPRVAAVLVMPRPERADDAALATISSGAGVDVVAATEQVGLLDLAGVNAAIPFATLDFIADYLVQRATSPPAVTECKTCDEAVVLVTADGRAVIERLERVGPRQLFAITTSVADMPGPTLVCVSAANAHRVGPSRLWPEMARAAAARGVCTVRYDRRSVGGSTLHGDGADNLKISDGGVLPAYSYEAVEDLVDVATAVAPDQTSLALVGLCSGAWAAATAAASASVTPHSIYLVNSGSWCRQPLPGAQPEVATVESITQGRPPASRISGLRDRLRPLVPYFVRLQRARRGFSELPEVVLSPVVEKGTVVTLLFGTFDAALFARHRGFHSVRRVSRRGTLHVEIDSLIDHSLVTRAARDLIAQRVIDEVATISQPASVRQD